MSAQKEILKDVEGYEGLYQVSTLGNVKSLERYAKHWLGGFRKIIERTRKPIPDSSGYLQVSLYKNGEMKNAKVHKLVCIAFLNHIPNGHKLVVNHINFDKLDNRVENLEIVTQRENSNQKHVKSSSKYVGVSWFKRDKKWQAEITINGKNKYLGRFASELNASNAYQNALKEIKS